MIIKLVRRPGNEKPDFDNPGILLWQSRESEERSGEFGQIPASVLREISPEFQVSEWFDVSTGRRMFGTAKRGGETWTEIVVLSPAGISQVNSVLQVAELVAAREMMTAAIDLASVLSSDGKVWIRVE